VQDPKEKDQGRHQKKFQKELRQSSGNKVKGNVAAVKSTEDVLSEI